ncbi:ubiquitin carboxyl-terminal hydrolase 45 isoform X1 [Schistocerca gregaria]|uniref:ubiquitin carboxyl-terminal hydrolase 45 isoform X1 n=1 Tax=Schistocerca gregaria TaxID=7010 RepID=UPI00211F23C4|nr:ubiquitin carboxyl-terminal hydrolase 45 isoform X1 [Schistocerca gregaria]XP_049854423.1 ubiquitin carboxyl-terminal hydrolase 45 isoform X1 [Schistocerca gregaria]XP_049854426.1 ubiquitin carboxyl-terminal hydrolase 45 isoform X1 [Schistocerca gregaria]XP_049854427.1 ubiquitin carboxyl-terminal hydrolase 45 isoform X1 [Schistocerca gregaria]
MGKKKKSRQQDPSLQNGADSTDSNDENQASATGGKCCPHVTKAVDFTRVKKALKPGGIASECAECLKSGAGATVSTDGTQDSGSMGGLWLCLRCGHQGCGRMRAQHALKHQRTPHSDSHALAVNTEQWKIWCYECDTEIDPVCRKKVHECVEFLKRLECPKPAKEPHLNGDVNMVNEPDTNQPLSDVTNTIAVVASSVEQIRKAVLNDLPRVRGLKNLGNTCFFNAVLQCLAQTPFLLPVLEEMKEAGAKFQLPGGAHPLLENEEKLPPLEGDLCKWRELTELLVDILHQLRSGRVEILDPRQLLDKLSQRCPQFAGGDQHDAHELLRHLLEEVRTEDLKRYQKTIMAKLGLSPKTDPASVDEEVKKKAKVYGMQAQELVLHPEQVFKGHLVSTLECQDCLHHSQRIESFLDLSLPINSDKPQPPAVRKKNSMESFDFGGNSTDDHPSKHQLKKERRMQRKARKIKKGFNADPHKAEPTIAEETNSKRNSGESEHSDADVEDNLEQEATLAPGQNGESGYSSEKADVGREDSGGSSPILGAPLLCDEYADYNDDEHIVVGPLLNNGDSALASPGSPTACAREADPLSIIPLPPPPPHSPSPTLSLPGRSELTLSLPQIIPLPPPPASSPTGAPSPASSDVSVEVACGSPVPDMGSADFADLEDRPFSRFGFREADDMLPTPNQSVGEETPVVDICSGIGTLSLSPGGAAGDETGAVLNGVTSCTPSPILSPPSPEGADEYDTKNRTLAPRYQCAEGECSVLSCLNQFTAIELMTGNNKVGCVNCTQRHNKGKEGKMVCTNSTKQLLISSPPAVLILHLKRFQVHVNTLRKITRHVTFPLVLDLAPICSTKSKESPTVRPDQNQIMYSLYGVVEHSGTLHGGHYVAFVKVRPTLSEDDYRWSFVPTSQGSHRNKSQAMKSQAQGTAEGGTFTPPPGRWYYVSDSRVREVEEEVVMRSQAYMLFYERIW